MPLQRRSRSLHLPESHVPAAITIEQLLAIRSAGDGLYRRIAGTCKSLQVRAADISPVIRLIREIDSPGLDGAVAAGGGELLPNWKPGDGINLRVVGLKGAHV